MQMKLSSLEVACDALLKVIRCEFTVLMVIHVDKKSIKSYVNLAIFEFFKASWS